ncbi:MAG: hypothetical protein J5563_08860 [Clostridia bacterium]|nr:hypothetical protein [Clostridia bacterium]
MRNLFKLISLIFVFAVVAVILATSCDKGGPDDSTDTNAVPDNINDDSFWLYEQKVHSPAEVDRTVDMTEVKKLYGGKITGKPENIVLTSGNQVLALEDRGDGSYSILTYIFDGTDYVKMFDGGHSLIDGSSLELYPTEYKTGKQDGIRACKLSGRDAQTGSQFTITCKAYDEQSLIEFNIAIIAGNEVDLADSSFGLFMNDGAEVTYSQMPPSIYGDYYGLGMPAAYLWDSGREAVILFDYTDMEWMGEISNAMPTQYKVMGRQDADGMFLGLNRLGSSRVKVRASTELKIDFCLYSGFSAKRTGLDCIAEKALAVAYAHPAKVQWPSIRSDLSSKNYSLDWKNLADRTVKGLLNEKSYNMVSLVMSDPILKSESRGSKLYLHYARPSADRYSATDFSCNNNWLSVANAYNRINKNTEFAKALETKMDALQFYYDPESNMIRYGFRFGNQVGTFEMPWQNFFYDVETWRASMTSSIKDYSPAALANFLSSIEGVTELVENSNYVVSQWIYPTTKTSATQQDAPDLGTVYEPWQIGSYAYMLVKAYDMSGDEKYLDLAATALNKVINEVSFSVHNNRYSREYTDSAEFPTTEIFGTAYGTYAAYRLFELRGNEEYLSWSEDFFGMLMQLTFWYDDNFSSAAEKSTWLGLFEPHAGASHPCPWETIEAYIPLTEILDATGDYVFNDLILKLFNCERISAFNFYPITWSDYFRNQAAYSASDFYGIPTEPMYNSFGGGNSDQGALYMSSISFWNYMMFSAFGEADNRDIMALNLNILSGYEEAMRSAERNFVLFNPNNESVTFRFVQRNLTAGKYKVTFAGKTGEYTSEELENGLEFTLEACESLRISVENTDISLKVSARQDAMTRQHIAYTYYVLREEIQKFTAGKFKALFPDAQDKDIELLCNYVMTYMDYGTAMAYAIDASNKSENGFYKDNVLSSLCNIYSLRSVLNGKLKKLVTELDALPEYFESMIDAIDNANELMKSGEYVKAYSICDSIVDSLKSGDVQSFSFSK